MKTKIVKYIVARYLIPLAALVLQIKYPHINPLWSGIGEIILDGEPYMGERLDKLGDSFSSLCILLIAIVYCSHNNCAQWVIPTLTSLYVYRHIIGYFLFLVTKRRKYLFFFPNFFSPVFVVHFLFVEIYKRKNLDKRIEYTCIGLVCILKIIHEYYYHYKFDQTKNYDDRLHYLIRS